MDDNIITTSELLRQSSPELPRSPAPSATARSKSVPPPTQLFEVNIDFDEASRAWRANKRSMGNGTYKYTCEKMISSGRKCSKDAWKNSGVCCTHKNKK